MRMIFVRHGDPDYEHDCLTPTGRQQAAAAAKRLSREGITTIYSSPNGRAMETAAFTAELLGLEIRRLDYMHEISWGGEGIPFKGHPWTLGDMMISQEDYDFFAGDWRRHPWFDGNTAVDYYDMIARQIDGLTLAHGYRHDGNRYLCEFGRDETIALFSHGGSGACALSHILKLPFPYMCTVMTFDFTSVTILDFPVRPGQYIHPRLALFNDAAHLSSGEQGPKIQQISE